MLINDTDKAAFAILFPMVVIVMTVEEIWNTVKTHPFCMNAYPVMDFNRRRHNVALHKKMLFVALYYVDCWIQRLWLGITCFALLSAWWRLDPKR
jgi:hypothetical protein